MSFFEIVADSLEQDRRREGTEGLAVLYPTVQEILHVGPARIHDDTAVAQSPRPPFHSSLEPTYDFSFGNPLRRQSAKLFFRQFRNSQSPWLMANSGWRMAGSCWLMARCRWRMAEIRNSPRLHALGA